MSTDTLVIVDSNYLCFVERYGMSIGLSYKGSETSIIFGFFRHILALARKYNTTSFAFVWDSKSSLRKKIYPGYKEARVKKAQELSKEDIAANQKAYKQFTELRTKALPMFGFPNVFMQEGYEGDDLIASIVLDQAEDRKCVVISADNDLLQLLDYCTLYNVSKDSVTTRKEFIRTYKIQPQEWIRVKQISGCTGDSVQGVNGIGDKKAALYIRGELKGKSLDLIENPESEKIIKFNRKLVALPFRGTDHFEIQEVENYSKKSFIKLCKHYGFRSFQQNGYAWFKAFKMK